MKFTISGFNQRKLIEFGLDLKDAALLRYFVDFKDTNSMSMLIIDNKPYYWVKYEHLKNDLPILGINSNVVLRRRLKKLEECGVLEHHHNLQGGSYSYYALGSAYKCLLEEEKELKDFNNMEDNTVSDPQTKKFKGQTEKFNPLNSKVQPLKPKSLTPQTEKFKQNNPSTKDKSTKDNNKKEKRKKETEFDIAINNYTENENLKTILYEFIKHRKAIKATMTTLALNKLLKKLDSLAANDSEKIKILENSILNGWKGIFPLSDKNASTKNNNNNAKSNKIAPGFNNFEGRHYDDYADLERQLLGR